LSLEAKSKQPQVEKTDSGPAARHEVRKQTKPAMHGEGGKQRAKYDAKQPGQQQQKLPSNAEARQNQTGGAKAKLPQKVKPSMQTNINEKMTIALIARQLGEHKKASPKAYGEQ